MSACWLISFLFLSIKFIHNNGHPQQSSLDISLSDPHFVRFTGKKCSEFKILGAQFDSCYLYDCFHKNVLQSLGEYDQEINALIFSLVSWDILGKSYADFRNIINNESFLDMDVLISFIAKHEYLSSAVENVALLLKSENCKNIKQDNMKQLLSSSSTDHGKFEIIYIIFKSCLNDQIHHKINTRHSHSSHGGEDSLRTGVNAVGISSAFFAWFLITIIGFFGFTLIPLKKYQTLYTFILQLLTALGFGTLVGDAIYHLLPHSLNHRDNGSDHHGHQHNDSHHHDDKETLKLTVFFIGIIFFYLVEIFIKWCPLTRSRECGCHTAQLKTCSDAELPVETNDHTHVHTEDHDHNHHECVNVEAAHDIKVTSAQHRLGAGVPPGVTATLNTQKLSPCTGDTQYDPFSENGVIIEKKNNCTTTNEAKNLVLILLIADMCHHIFDGLAIGASFTSSSINGFNDGVSTAVAIAFHELPHKIGDIVLLVKSGYTEKKATIIVVGTSTVSLIGVIVGCITSQQFENAAVWINLFTAGMFFYIALVLMMSQMINAISSEEISRLLIIFSHVVGVTVGIGIMILIAKYEH